MQVTIHEGAIDPTPLPRENEEPRRVDEENDTLCIYAECWSSPRWLADGVDKSSGPHLTSRGCSTEEWGITENTLTAQIDQAIDEEVNLRSSLSLARGENMESPLGASHEDFEPRTANKEWIAFSWSKADDSHNFHPFSSSTHGQGIEESVQNYQEDYSSC